MHYKKLGVILTVFKGVMNSLNICAKKKITICLKFLKKTLAKVKNLFYNERVVICRNLQQAKIGFGTARF